MIYLLKNNKKVIKEIVDFYKNVVKNKLYYFPIFLCTLIAYSFSMFNKSVSVDDLAQSYYYKFGGVKDVSYRWGQVLCNRLFSTIEYTPFINQFFGVAFYILTAVLLSCIIYELGNKKVKIKYYTIFSCLLVTYPLINEIWVYYESLTIPFDFSICSFCLLYVFIINDIKIKDIVYLGILLSFVASGYESLIFAYITIVFIILFIRYCYIKNDGNWLKEGFKYAYPLFVAFLLRILIGKLLILLFGYEKSVYSSSGISWLINGFKTSLIQLIFNGWYYGVRSLSYFPITEFAIALIIFFVILIKLKINGNKHLVIGIFLFLSLFFLPILQGAHYPYRTAQPIQIFIAFIFVFGIYQMQRIYIKKIFIIIASLLCLRQSIYLHQLLALNNQKAENEAQLIQQLGYELYSEHDITKVVIFVGEYDFGDFINRQISIDYDSLVGKFEKSLRSKFGYDGEIYDLNLTSDSMISCINWAENAFDSQIMIKEYFSYYGYDINVLDKFSSKDYDYYLKLAEDNNANIYDILEFEDYIIVVV